MFSFFYFYPTMKSLLFISFLLLLNLKGIPQEFDFNKNCQSAYREIIELDFKEADNILKSENQVNPNNLMPLYLENYMDFLRIIIGENREEFQNLENNKGARLKEISDGPENSPYYLFCEANINLQWAFARIKFEEYFTAFFEINRAYRKLEKNQEKFPDFYPNKIGLGLLHTIIGTVPDNYKWITNLIGMEGNVNEGISELLTFIDSAKHDGSYQDFIPEALFLLSFIQMNIGLEKDYLSMIEQSMSTFDIKSPLMVFVKASYYIKSGQNEQALKVLSNYEPGPNSYPFYYLNYLRGLTLLRKLDTSARNDFRLYIQNFKGRSYLASARQKIAWSYLIYGDTLAYKKTIASVTKAPESIADADHQALKEARQKEIPDVSLLRSRLLFDGGYYQESLITLDSINLSGKNNSIITEYNYRHGRIYQQMHNFEKALECFKGSILSGKSSKTYFAANAALQSGIISEEQGDLESAKRYYTLCLDMDFDEYERSIKHKAKARLERIK